MIRNSARCSARSLLRANLSVSLFVAIAFTPWIASGQDAYLVKRNAPWRYHAAKAEPATDWRTLEFDDQNWPQGRAGFGYGDGDDRTVLKTMRGQFARVQIRTEFTVANAASLDRLYLYVSYDDGFVASLNGVEVLRQNVARTNAAIAAGNHEAAGFEEFVIPNARSLLRKGRNVLAIEGFNRSVDSSDFSLHPALSARREATARITLTRNQAVADINQLERRIEDQSSYAQRNRFDRKHAFAELRQSVKGEISVFELGENLQRLVARIGDCHARVDTPMTDPRSLYLPFMLADTKDGVAALKIDRSALLDPNCPFVTAIDGVPLDRWLDVAATFVPAGSQQFNRLRSLAAVRRVDQMRRRLRLKAAPQATVTLQSRDGREVRRQTLKLVDRPAPFGRVPIARSKILEGNIGYLRIAQMDNRLERAISEQMRDFRNTRGLIIDVRDNGGGRYGIMRLLYGYLTPADGNPYVTNICAYRKSRLFAADHLHYRPTFREGYAGWNDRERAVIKAARDTFKPEWTPPSGLFSEWHYMVLDKTAGVGQYHYDKRVVVLCNSRSFSATDGFLSCMADIPGVTLLGEPSGGGSGATRRFTLSESGIRIALSSMASFRPNGKLFDGNGVEVDILMKPTVSDYLGETDTVRNKAIEFITAK